MKKGIAELRLHRGHAPKWLFGRMVKLADKIVYLMIDEYGVTKTLERLSDPFWFQAFSNTIGWDWDSSGATTVVCAVLKEVTNQKEFGFKVAGGKGKTSLKTPTQLDEISKEFNLKSEKAEFLKHASRLAAKVDNNLIQAGYRLYHHSFLVSEQGNWTIVQQGMNPELRLARRYHWFSKNVKSFVQEPHQGIVGFKHDKALNLVDRQSKECRKTSVDLVNEGIRNLKREFSSFRPKNQRSLSKWLGKEEKIIRYEVPKRMNWAALRRAYEINPKEYETLISIKGIGPATIRGLALISDLVYGDEPSWVDPTRYSFTVGGKDGVPHFIRKDHYDEVVNTLKSFVEGAELGKKEKSNALKRLKETLPKSIGAYE